MAAIISTIGGIGELSALGVSVSPRMPVLFIGHGNPMYAIQPNEFAEELQRLAVQIPHPACILCISAHWYVKGTYVTAMPKPRTIHDFGGFPKALFDVQYPAPGDPAMAAETRQLLSPAEVQLDDSWGLDHGAWSVIKHLFPKADVPVIQLSIDYTQSPQWHYDLAKRLSVLRNRGVLMIGSGNIVHNLGLVDFANIDRIDYGFDWAAEARELVNQAILKGDHQTLIRYQSMPAAIKKAIPTPDHFIPLLYALALQNEKDEITLFNDKLVAGSLSMTSVLIGNH